MAYRQDITASLDVAKSKAFLRTRTTEQRRVTPYRFVPWLCLAAIVVGGFALRVHHLENIALWMDETDFFNEQAYSQKPAALLDYVIDRKDHTTSTVGWPAMVWVSTRLFGQTAAAGRTITVLLGTAAIVGVFFVVYLSTSGAFPPALIAASLTAISIPLMELSQRTHPYGAIPFFSTLIILTHLWVVSERDSGPRPLSSLAPALFFSSFVGAVSMFVNATLAVAAGVSFLVIVAVLSRGFFRRTPAERVILAIFIAFAGLVFAIAAVATGKNPKYGRRSYLADYYHDFNWEAIPFLLLRAYDLLTYHLNLFFNENLYWPLSANWATLPLVALALLGWSSAFAGRFGVIPKRLATLGLVSAVVIALLSLRGSFPFGGVRQTMFLAPFVMAFTALGFYSLRFARWAAAGGGLVAAAYLACWAQNLPAFYADRAMPFRPEEIGEAWARNGKLVVYDQMAASQAIRYWTRDRTEIAIKTFTGIPQEPFLLVSLSWPLETPKWGSPFIDKLQQAGFSITLLKSYPAKHMASWRYPTCLYFPPSGLWIYKVAK